MPPRKAPLKKPPLKAAQRGCPNILNFALSFQASNGKTLSLTIEKENQHILEEKGFYIDTITNLKTAIIKGYSKSSLDSLNERIVSIKNPTTCDMLQWLDPMEGLVTTYRFCKQLVLALCSEKYFSDTALALTDQGIPVFYVVYTLTITTLFGAP